MRARHLFIMMDAFTPDDEVTGGAKGLLSKHGPNCHTVSTLWLDAQKRDVRSAGEKGACSNEKLAGNAFPTRVGLYIVTHMNNPFHLAGPDGVAKLVCDHLDGLKESLGIDCTMLDKVVLVTCVGSDDLKGKYQDKVRLKEMDRFVHKQDKYYVEHAKSSRAWDDERQKELDKAAEDYAANPEGFLKTGGNTMTLFACALDRRGVHPKIAAWDSGLYVNVDGSKSIHGVDGSRVLRHQRLKHKMMMQFRRSESGAGSIVQLSLHDWSDKDAKTLNLPKVA